MHNKHFFRKAYELAESARGSTGINPFVGAVVVNKGKIVGMGCTQPCGSNHAEIEALSAAGEKAKGGDLYVTLEPCCHYGRTPPCTDMIIKAGIKRVFAGIQDPNERVNGKGFQALKNAGINIVTNIMKEEIEKQLEAYITNQKKHRPFFVMKNAVSLDAKIAAANGASRWITSVQSREYVHKLRKEIKVILTGINTVLQDDPLLNVRYGNNQDKINSCLLRIVLDSELKIPVNSQIVSTAAGIPTLIVKSQSYHNSGKEKILHNKQVEILSIPSRRDGKLDLKYLIKELNHRQIPSVLVEAGSSLNSYLLGKKLVDKFYYFIAPKILGGNMTVFNDLGITSPANALPVKIDSISKTGDDILLLCYPQWLTTPKRSEEL